MTIKLEAGKYYRNCKGDVVGPLQKSNFDRHYKFKAGFHYMTNGRIFIKAEDEDDLIEEVPNPNEQPMPSDYHLQRALDFMDSLNSVEDFKKYPELCTCTIKVARYIAQHEPEHIREAGYYWVKVGAFNEWKIGHYEYGVWSLNADENDYDADEFLEISEHRITPPE